MARLADEYKWWNSEAEVKVYLVHLTKAERLACCREIGETEKEDDYLKVWRIAKPPIQNFFCRLFDAYKVLMGEYDAVYYHKEEASDARRIIKG